MSKCRRRKKEKKALIIIVVVALVCLCVSCYNAPTSSDLLVGNTSYNDNSGLEKTEEKTPDYSELFNKVQLGMTKSEVDNILGSTGEVFAQTAYAESYVYKVGPNKYFTMIFQDGKLGNKLNRG